MKVIREINTIARDNILSNVLGQCMNRIKSYKLFMAIILKSTQKMESQTLELHLKYYSYNIDSLVFLVIPVWTLDLEFASAVWCLRKDRWWEGQVKRIGSGYQWEKVITKLQLRSIITVIYGELYQQPNGAIINFTARFS